MIDTTIITSTNVNALVLRLYFILLLPFNAAVNEAEGGYDNINKRTFTYCQIYPTAKVISSSRYAIANLLTVKGKRAYNSRKLPNQTKTVSTRDSCR